MNMNLGIFASDLKHMKLEKDSTLAIMIAAQKKGFQLFYLAEHSLFLRDGQAYASMQSIQISDLLLSLSPNVIPHKTSSPWYHLGESIIQKLSDLSCILIRKDPPFDLEYLYSTYILEQAQQEGVLVVNDPQALRDANEKLYCAWFPQCCPPTLVTSNIKLLREFLIEFKDIILKPLDQMGGRGIFRIRQGDLNTSVIFETATRNETQTIMAQQYLPAIAQGDKRILMIGGVPVPYALARIPQIGETRGNMAAGGQTQGIELSVRDYELCEAVGTQLKEKGLWFVGLDVIGDFITEINVTSPTGIRELNKYFGLSIADQYLDFLGSKL